MNRQGSALVLGLFVILILSVLSSTFLYKQINQSLISNRCVDSVRALWLAEAGVQAVRNNRVNQASTSGTLGAGNFSATSERIGSSDYFYVVSNGTVGSISKVIEAVVSVRSVTQSNFPYAVQSTVDINFNGNARVYGENTTPLEQKTRDAQYYLANSTFSFTDLFSFSSTEIKALSTVYNNTFPADDFEGLNWVVAPSSMFTGDIHGQGVLIVEGNLRIAGTIDFDGIIYVIGELDMAGTAQVNGAILAESAASVDTSLTGTCDVQHNATKISTALDNVRYRSPQIVSWKELY